MAAPSYEDLGALLGRTVSQEQGNAVLQNVTAMVKAYVRGGSGWEPNDELRAVILSAACRMIANPRGIELSETLGPQSISFRGSFAGWTVAETFVLNRYRERAL